MDISWVVMDTVVMDTSDICIVIQYNVNYMGVVIKGVCQLYGCGNQRGVSTIWVWYLYLFPRYHRPHLLLPVSPH